jgi:hypothetical protein
VRWRHKEMAAVQALGLDDDMWSAAATVQRAWKCMVAKRLRVAQAKRNIMLNNAALRVQLTWYRRNKMFTAFLLMRCLVVQHMWEVEDDAMGVSAARCAAAVIMQTAWRKVMGARRMTFIRLRQQRVKQLQRWWRQRRFNRHLLLLCAGIWSYATMSRRARDIQRVWWRAKPGRLLASLKVRDLALEWLFL